MKERLFAIALVDYEEYSQFLFIGPAECSKQDWEKICAKAMEEAVPEVFVKAIDDNVSIDTHDLVQAAIPKLAEQGFEYVADPKTASYRSGVFTDVPHDDPTHASVDYSLAKALGHWAEKVAEYNSDYFSR